jgi:hypothetical protein
MVFGNFKMRECLSSNLTVQKIACFLHFSLNKLKVSVPRHFGTGPILQRYRGTICLVPSILSPLDRGEWTVSKNANHCKTSRPGGRIERPNLGCSRILSAP